MTLWHVVDISVACTYMAKVCEINVAVFLSDMCSNVSLYVDDGISSVAYMGNVVVIFVQGHLTV